MGRPTSFPDHEHGQDARRDEEEERDEDEAGPQRVLPLQDAVLRDQEQDGAEATGDAGRDGPGGEDLRDALPAPVDAVGAESGDAGPDDAADDGMPGRMGQAHVSERRGERPDSANRSPPLSSSVGASRPRRLLEKAERANRRRRKGRTYVVDTGRPMRVAMVSQVEEPTRAHTMASINTAGSSSKKSVEMSFFRMVSATREPTRTAPRNSQKVAMIMACVRVRDLDETEVANELATSLAPMFQASMKAKMTPKAKM